MTSRYRTTGAEGEFEPGSDEQVLRNLVGITSPDDMDALELQLLGELYDEVPLQNLPDRRLTVADVMAVQAGHEPLDYSSWEQHKPACIGAIHAGFSGDYGPMEQFVVQAIHYRGYRPQRASLI